MTPELQRCLEEMYKLRDEFIRACRARDLALATFMDTGATEPGLEYITASQEMEKAERQYHEAVDALLTAKRQQR